MANDTSMEADDFVESSVTSKHELVMPNNDELALNSNSLFISQDQSPELWPSSPYQEMCDALRAFCDWDPSWPFSQLDENLSGQPDPLICDGEGGVEGQENGETLEVPLPDSDHSPGLSDAQSPLPRSLLLSPSALHQCSSHRRDLSTQQERDHARKKAAAILKQINLLSSLQASLTWKYRKLVLMSHLQD